jgi:hypothetical protein
MEKEQIIYEGISRSFKQSTKPRDGLSGKSNQGELHTQCRGNCGLDIVETVGCRMIAAWHGPPFPKGASKIKGEVTLTDEQADVCRTILCQELMKVSSLLASGKMAADGS